MFSIVEVEWGDWVYHEDDVLEAYASEGLEVVVCARHTRYKGSEYCCFETPWRRFDVVESLFEEEGIRLLKISTRIGNVRKSAVLGGSIDLNESFKRDVYAEVVKQCVISMLKERAQSGGCDEHG